MNSGAVGPVARHTWSTSSLLPLLTSRWRRAPLLVRVTGKRPADRIRSARTLAGFGRGDSPGRVRCGFPLLSATCLLGAQPDSCALILSRQRSAYARECRAFALHYSVGRGVFMRKELLARGLSIRIVKPKTTTYAHPVLAMEVLRRYESAIWPVELRHVRASAECGMRNHVVGTGWRAGLPPGNAACVLAVALRAPR